MYANYMKINKITGRVSLLLFKADVNFPRFSNFNFQTYFTHIKR